MIRIIISLIVGSIVYFASFMSTGNPLMSLLAGVFTFIFLSIVTNKDYMKGREERRRQREREEKQARRWKRESYHKERGRKLADSDHEREEQYDSYNELDIRNIGHNPKRIKRMFG